MAPKRLPLAPAPAPEGVWYEAGIRFECQRSGKCCTNHGEYAYVYLEGDDEARLARHLGLAVRAFRRRHTLLVEGHRALRSRNDACIFLAGTDCSVHEAKPRQCQAWPFWRETTRDRRVWQEEVASFCPGVGKGRLWTREEIDAIVASDGDEEGDAD